jgi:hypothetical protein
MRGVNQDVLALAKAAPNEEFNAASLECGVNNALPLLQPVHVDSNRFQHQDVLIPEVNTAKVGRGSKGKGSKSSKSRKKTKLNPDAPTFMPKSQTLFVRQVKFSDRSLFLTGEIQGVSTSVLLDTGAALTCISGEMWRQCTTSSPNLTVQEVNGSLQSATGENLEILGVVDLEFQLGSLKLKHSAVVVENLAHTCLLGSDFFSDHQCTISYDTVSLSIGDVEIPLRRQQEEPKLCRIILGKGIKIPANTEMILPGKLSKSGSLNHSVPGMVEAKQEIQKFATGRSLVRSDHGKVPVRVANFSDSPLYIRTNQTLGWFHPVAEIQTTNEVTNPSDDRNKTYRCPKRTKKTTQDKKPSKAKSSRSKDRSTEDNSGKVQANEDFKNSQPSQLTKLNDQPTFISAVTSGEDTSVNKSPEMGAEDKNRLESLLKKLEIDELQLDSGQKEMVIEMIGKYQHAFSMGDFDLGQTTVLQHKIDTGDAIPIKQRPRRVPPYQQKFVNETTKELLDRGLIKESQSPWSSPIVLAKKSDGTYRLCIDYRRLNSHTVKSAQPLARIDDTLNQLSGAQFFTSLDCASGYWQVGMAPEDQGKTSFVTGVKQYDWKVMPFGLTGAPASFTRLMNIVLGGLDFCLVYLDDIIVHSSTFEEHLQQLEKVLCQLEAANLKLKPSKCKLFRDMVKFLGHVVNKDGISTDSEKLRKVAEWPVAEVRSFMGLATYYQNFVKDFANIAAPLHRLTRKNTAFEWTDNCETAFLKLKECLVSSPVLAYPDFSEGSGVFVLDTDASDFAMGGVLSQKQKDESERVIGYGSKSFQGGELNYCTTRREMLALVKFAEHFRYYLLGKKFLVRTDNMALRWLLNFKEPSGQIARWIERLAEFDFIIEHRPGVRHGNADALSRRPARVRQHGDCPSCGPTDATTSTAPEEEFNASSLESGVNNALPLLLQSKYVRSKDADDKCLHHTVGALHLPGKPDDPVSHSKWSREEIAEAQKTDPHISDIYDHIAKDKSEPSKETLQAYGHLQRAVWAQRARMEMCDGILYLRPDKESKYKTRRLVLPRYLIEPVFHELHEGFAGGHLGIRKTEGKMRQRCWRPNLKREIRDLVRSCETCQKCKSPPHATKAPLQSIPVGRRNQRVHVDVIGPINPPSRQGHKYILVLQDAFTKWPEAWPLRNQKAKTCARTIVHEYICRFGAPENLHTDQGTNFQSCIFDDMCKILNIHKTRTTAFHPQGNGQVENFNKSLKSMLTTMVDEEGRDWDQHLPAALMAYRSSIHLSTEETPFLLTFGDEMQLPLDLVIGTTGGGQDNLRTDYISQLRDRLGTSFQRARSKLKLAQRRQRSYYDRNSKNTSFSVGDLVLMKNHYVKPNVPPKFHRSWIGPFRVLEVISEVNYRVIATHGKNPKAKVVHLNNMKLYFTREDDSQILEDTLPVNGDDNSVLGNEESEDDSEASDSESEFEYSTPGGPMCLRSDRVLEQAISPIVNEPDLPLMDEAAPEEEFNASSLESGVANAVPLPNPNQADTDSVPEKVTRKYDLRPRDKLRCPIRYRQSIGSVTLARIIEKKTRWLKKGHELRNALIVNPS